MREERCRRDAAHHVTPPSDESVRRADDLLWKRKGRMRTRLSAIEHREVHALSKNTVVQA